MRCSSSARRRRPTARRRMSGVHVRLRLGGESTRSPSRTCSRSPSSARCRRCRAPRAVLGVRNLRGQVLPVFDLASSSGSGRRPPGMPRRRRGRRPPAGLAIDEVTDVGELPRTAEETDSRFLAGALWTTRAHRRHRRRFSSRCWRPHDVVEPDRSRVPRVFHDEANERLDTMVARCSRWRAAAPVPTRSTPLPRRAHDQGRGRRCSASRT